jgi:hypothetical protein
VTDANAVIVGINDRSGVNIPAGTSVPIKNSQTGIINDQGSSLSIDHSSVYGGSQVTQPTIAGGNLTVTFSNIYGGKDGVNCGSDCTVEDSWLHDNYPAASGGAHQQGFYAGGGTNYILQHNSIYCVGNCTADISLIPNSDISTATISKNLLVASTSAYCLYAGSDPPVKPGIVNQISVTSNVFQKGSNGQCGTFGPVAYFDAPNSTPGTSGYNNVWTGNVWDDGSVLSR